jgi:hypothetical protein
VKEFARLLNDMQRARVIRDYAVILALLESGSVSQEAIGQLAARHGLADAWHRFQSRFLHE